VNIDKVNMRRAKGSTEEVCDHEGGFKISELLSLALERSIPSEPHGGCIYGFIH
jgi:hypothetical protein